MTDAAARDLKMFGVPSADIINEFDNSMSKQMYVLSMLSDAQESMVMGNNEYARQLLNRAKLLLSRMPASVFSQIILELS
jgi:hypothetical protein